MNFLPFLRTYLSEHHAVELSEVLCRFHVHFLTLHVAFVSDQKLHSGLVNSRGILDPLKTFLIAVHQDNCIVEVGIRLTYEELQLHITACFDVVKFDSARVSTFGRSSSVRQL